MAKAQASTGKDKQVPVITSASINNGSPIQFGYQYGVPISATVTDNVGVFQVIFQVDPIGDTYPAPDQRNKAFWQAVDFYKNSYEFTPSLSALSVGSHILRVSAYDRERNLATKEITFQVV